MSLEEILSDTEDMQQDHVTYDTYLSDDSYALVERLDYADYLDRFAKPLMLVNEPGLGLAGWTYPSHGRAPIYINVAYNPYPGFAMNVTAVHESAHEADPYASEQTIRMRTGTEYLPIPYDATYQDPRSIGAFMGHGEQNYK